MTTVRLPVLPLTADAFAPFGTVVRPPANPPGRTGEGWASWYGSPEIECPRPLTFGYVTTDPRPVVVTEMERHPITFELLIPHGDDLVQVVAPPEELDDEHAVPRATDCAAFLVPVGSSVVLAAGTWHSPAFPAGGVPTTYTFACMRYDQPYTPEWIAFHDGDDVRAE